MEVKNFRSMINLVCGAEGNILADKKRSIIEIMYGG